MKFSFLNWNDLYTLYKTNERKFKRDWFNAKCRGVAKNINTRKFVSKIVLLMSCNDEKVLENKRFLFALIQIFRFLIMFMNRMTWHIDWDSSMNWASTMDTTNCVWSQTDTSEVGTYNYNILSIREQNTC
jgi:hypothetical protein